MTVLHDLCRILISIALTVGGVYLATLPVPGLFIIGVPIAVIGFAMGMSVAAGE